MIISKYEIMEKSQLARVINKFVDAGLHVERKFSILWIKEKTVAVAV